jgi:hypothetical protein
MPSKTLEEDIVTPGVLPSSPARGSLEPPVEQSPSKNLEEDIVTPGVPPSSPARGSLEPPVEQSPSKILEEDILIDDELQDQELFEPESMEVDVVVSNQSPSRKRRMDDVSSSSPKKFLSTRASAVHSARNEVHDRGHVEETTALSQVQDCDDVEEAESPVTIRDTSAAFSEGDEFLVVWHDGCFHSKTFAGPQRAHTFMDNFEQDKVSSALTVHGKVLRLYAYNPAWEQHLRDYAAKLKLETEKERQPQDDDDDDDVENPVSFCTKHTEEINEEDKIVVVWHDGCFHFKAFQGGKNKLKAHKFMDAFEDDKVTSALTVPGGKVLRLYAYNPAWERRLRDYAGKVELETGKQRQPQMAATTTTEPPHSVMWGAFRAPFWSHSVETFFAPNPAAQAEEWIAELKDERKGYAIAWVCNGDILELVATVDQQKGILPYLQSTRLANHRAVQEIKRKHIPEPAAPRVSAPKKRKQPENGTDDALTKKQRTDQTSDSAVDCTAIGKRPRPSTLPDPQPKQAKVSKSIPSRGHTSSASDNVTVLWFDDGKPLWNIFYADKETAHKNMDYLEKSSLTSGMVSQGSLLRHWAYNHYWKQKLKKTLQEHGLLQMPPQAKEATDKAAIKAPKPLAKATHSQELAAPATVPMPSCAQDTATPTRSRKPPATPSPPCSQDRQTPTKPPSPSPKPSQNSKTPTKAPQPVLKGPVMASPTKQDVLALLRADLMEEWVGHGSGQW